MIIKSGKMEIKVLGPGCANCKKMREMTTKAVADLGVDARVDYITDMVEIMKYVMSTPGLVVNGKVKHSGKPLPSQDKVKALIQEEI